MIIRRKNDDSVILDYIKQYSNKLYKFQRCVKGHEKICKKICDYDTKRMYSQGLSNCMTFIMQYKFFRKIINDIFVLADIMGHESIKLTNLFKKNFSRCKSKNNRFCYRTGKQKRCFISFCLYLSIGFNTIAKW